MATAHWFHLRCRHRLIWLSGDLRLEDGSRPVNKS
jgi:hypothetical protein